MLARQAAAEARRLDMPGRPAWPNAWPARSTRPSRPPTRRDLIAVAARAARHGHLTLNLPEGWHREQD